MKYSPGWDGIFLRPLSPYGFAVKTKQIQKYDAKRWLDFYQRGLRYILSKNRSGRTFFEFYTLLLLRRILSDQPIGYVDLRSPAGIGLGRLSTITMAKCSPPMKAECLPKWAITLSNSVTSIVPTIAL